MQKTILGRTGLSISRTAFGALPIQRVSTDEAVTIVRAARDAGIDFFDTARGYSDSEQKLGKAFEGVRGSVIIATKTHGGSRKDVLESIETSLRMLRTDYIDIIQLHNPKTLPEVSNPEGSYAGLVEARRKGMVRFFGLTNHSIALARQAARSGAYDTVQFPLSLLSADSDLGLINDCHQVNVGLIAMKALAGGLITNIEAAFAFLRQYENVVPIWGVQAIEQLKQFVTLEANPPALTDSLLCDIARDREDLSGLFCRGCGYCLPCPQSIEIPTVARMSLLLRRAPWRNFVTDEGRARMLRIRECIECGACAGRCPYGIDTPSLIKSNLEDYERFFAEHVRT